MPHDALVLPALQTPSTQHPFAQLCGVQVLCGSHAVNASSVDTAAHHIVFVMTVSRREAPTRFEPLFDVTRRE